MNIFIAGGGRVGFHLARLLSASKQEVSVIESDPDQLEQIDYALDVSTAMGDGASALLMQSLGVSGADLFVASMGSDETNLISAAMAKGLGAKQVVARVDKPMYIEANILYESVLGIDYILSPDSLAALEIANYIEHPGILFSENLGRGLVQICQLRVDQSPMTGGKTLKDVVPPGSGVLVGMINRAGASIIPHGDAVIEKGDHITLVGQHDKMAAIQRLFLANAPKPSRVAIMGGNTLGFLLAQAIEGKMKSLKIFERREDRCDFLSTRLERTKIISRDASTRVSLEQEHLDNTDVFVAATGDDERNIMSAVLAKEVGARKVVAVVHHPDFAPLVARLGIDHAITPRACVANRVLRIVHQGQVTSLTVLGEGQIEVAEIEVGSASPVLEQPIKDWKSKFPRGALIATVLRGDKVFVPSGNDQVLAGDSVVLIASSESLELARKLLQKH